MNDYDYYSRKFRQHIYEYLYGNETAPNVLQKIEDLTKIYYISLDTKDSYIGLISFITCTVIISIMFLSLIFIFKENYSLYFKFLTGDSWFMIVFGLMIILSSSYTTLGRIDNIKCTFNEIMHYSGLNLMFLPILHKLIVNFPAENNFSDWVENHKFSFLSILISINIILIIVLYISKSFVVDDLVGGNEKIFQVCKWNTKGTIAHVLILGYTLIIFIIILFLIFTEWNIESTCHDIKLITYSIYINIITIIINGIFKLIIINDYHSNYIIRICLVLISSVSSYVLIYGHRIAIGIINNKNMMKKYIDNINKDFINDKKNDSKTVSIFKTTEYNTNAYNNEIDNYTFNNNNSNNNSINDNNNNNNKSESDKSSSKHNKKLSKIIKYHYISNTQ